MSLTGRPSRPPLALVSSSQIFMPSSACLPKPASGPVSAMPKPMAIGWPDGVCACVGAGNAATEAAARRAVAKPRHFSRTSMVSSGVGFVEPFVFELSPIPWLNILRSASIVSAETGILTGVESYWRSAQPISLIASPVGVWPSCARGGTIFGANEAQVTDDFIAAAMVRRMIDAVDHRHVGKIKRAHALQARGIDPVLVRVGAAAMVRVDAASRAEVVLRNAGIEPVFAQRLFTGLERNGAGGGRHRHRAAHPAIRAGAAAGGVQTVDQFHSEAHGAAVACRFHFRCFIFLHHQAPELRLPSNTLRASRHARAAAPCQPLLQCS